MSLLQAVRSFCTQFPAGKKYWLAYSGGMDSEVLLSICSQLRMELKMDLHAIHINHSLSPHAKTWAKHCKNHCELLDIDYVERTIQLNLQAGDSLEEIAREKRYAIFAEYLAEGDVLFTAHHQDDQAETVLLQLMRGAGPKGLAAMPTFKSFASGFQARPLLAFSRADLEHYARENHLTWVDDESNADITFSRNFIRHEIMPRLRSRFPSVTASLARSAQHCAENQMLLEHFSRELDMQGSRANTLSVAKLLQCSPEKQKCILRTWIHQLGYISPNTKTLNTILQTVLSAAWDSSPLVEWGEVRLRRHKDDLHLVKACDERAIRSDINWEIEQTLLLPDIGVLKTQAVTGSGLRADITHVVVNFRQGGEVVDLGKRGRHTLKNLFQEWNILPWERGSIPLIFVADRLIAIAGYFLHEEFLAKENEMGREIIFERVFR